MGKRILKSNQTQAIITRMLCSHVYLSTALRMSFQLCGPRGRRATSRLILVFRPYLAVKKDTVFILAVKNRTLR